MLNEKVEKALNKQIRVEAESSQVYLSMASWAELKGLEGIAQFMYKHSDEERGGHAIVSELNAPKTDFGSFQQMFKELLEHEIFVSQSINDLVHITLEEKDYATHNFLQWYVAEQIEEEALARTILDKINLIGNDKGGLYLFDRDVQQIAVQSAAGEPGA